jgi:type VI secretion system protein ImpL
VSSFLNFRMGGGLTLWFFVAWFIGELFGVQGSKLMQLRVTLLVIGVVAALIIGWFQQRKAARTKEAAGERAEANLDIQMLLNEAERKLSASQLAGKGGIKNAPVILVMGSQGSTKTTSILQSGTEPELIAGQVYMDGSVTPTALGNVWYAQNAVLIEAGAQLASQPPMWARLINHLRPKRLKSIFGGNAAPRAVVVCYDCESLTKTGATEAADSAAKALRLRLMELSAGLGISVPVYVLFTKLDRVAFFLDYARTFTSDEATQVFGATIPIARERTGVYGEYESRLLGDTFQQLVSSLCDRRPELLCRESDETVLPAAYEFPREFRKLRGPALQFLIELCRPSQLSTGPFLRGFYFSGVRPVVVQEELAAQADTAKQSSGEPDATRMFRYGQGARAAAATKMVTKRVPQWVFLPHLFSDVLLADKTALAASGSSVKANVLRRALLGAAVLLCLVFGLGTLISYIRNESLAREVRGAAQLVSSDPAAPKLASVDSLTRLDGLRKVLVRLRGYEKDGPPFSMRWGLYSGSSLLSEARRLYFDRFRLLLFGDTQQGLLSSMRSWPATPGRNDDYGDAYNTLKAYLITTSHHTYATQTFLPPVLQARWTAGRAIEPDRAKLARSQFDFYTSELAIANPYSSGNDAATIESARRYLAQFAGAARVYQTMLNEANQAAKPVIFNQRFPGSSEVVINTREMAGAYTKPGYAFMQNALKDPSKYVSGEPWVLGSYASAAIDTSKLQSEIRALYYADYVNQWRDYLAKSVVVRYANLADAAKKLNVTASPQSPLMALFWLATQNTAVDAPEITRAFKPLHALMPPANVDQYIGPSNTNYMTALTSLQNVLDQTSKLPPEQSQTAADQSAAAANSARLAAKTTALTLGVDQEAHVESTIDKLLQDPITYAEAVKPEGPSPAPLNAAGAAFCSQYRALMAKFPFDSSAKAYATIEDVNSIFRPQSGALWTFYEQKLKAKLPKQGATYTPTSDKPVITPRFAAFFNNAARLSNTLYSNGSSQDPKLTFALKPAFSPDVQSVAITIDGQQATIKPNAAPQQFSWPGSGGVSLILRAPSDQVFPSYDGLWAVFEFFYDADKPVPSPEWMLKGGRSDRAVKSPVTNQPYAVHFDLDMMGAPPVFQKGFFHDQACVAEVAK